jgi:uncharacterized protein
MLPFLLPALAQVAPAVADREIVVPAYHGTALKASIRSAQGHPCFAVMVADSGPTNRDWSSPLLKDPENGAFLESHAGRDLAQWFQRQGIGSLRYDKRLVESRDPKLDVTLDAQLGDLKAMLQAARSLPEARGKRILLVGHGEGALLSLLAAGDADALLLVNMPGQSMAGIITGQVRKRLPDDIAKPNLAYLENVYQAIRDRKPLPAAGKDVHPSMEIFAASLMAPETLSFVRSTLDLDPWALASKLTIPCAVAWGDKDIQDPKPEKIPDSFHGRIIDLPGANHLLKQENRPLKSLFGPEALSTYGDNTPMANLAPLATWLKDFIQR